MVAAEDFESTEFLNRLIGGMAEGVIFIDAENIVRICNPVGGEIRGVKGVDIVGKPFLDCHPERVYEKVLELIEKLKTGERREISRVVCLGERFFEHSYSAVRDEEGGFLGVVAVSRDITERRILENQLVERTRMLEQSNRLKDLFADIMSHDFINPSSVIMNYADMLLESELPRDSADYVTSIRGSAQKLVNLITDARKFSRLEESEDLTLESMNITAIIDGSLKGLEKEIAKKKIKIVWKNKPAQTILVSPIIEDVFTNLLSNAVKYSSEKSKVVLNVEDPGESTVVSVSDQAEKIERAHWKNIFERFTRVGKESVEGSGLGLAIVKRIVELHRGRVWVEDNPVGGNTFKVELPKKTRENKKRKKIVGG